MLYFILEQFSNFLGNFCNKNIFATKVAVEGLQKTYNKRNKYIYKYRYYKNWQTKKSSSCISCVCCRWRHIPRTHCIPEHGCTCKHYNALQHEANPKVVVQLEPQLNCNFKLPIFAGKEDNDLSNQYKSAFNKIRLYNVPKRHWVKEMIFFLEGLVLVWVNNWIHTIKDFIYDEP